MHYARCLHASCLVLCALSGLGARQMYCACCSHQLFSRRAAPTSSPRAPWDAEGAPRLSLAVKVCGGQAVLHVHSTGVGPSIPHAHTHARAFTLCHPPACRFQVLGILNNTAGAPLSPSPSPACIPVASRLASSTPLAPRGCARCLRTPVRSGASAGPPAWSSCAVDGLRYHVPCAQSAPTLRLAAGRCMYVHFPRYTYVYLRVRTIIKCEI